MRMRPVGADALLVELADTREATGLYGAARRRGVPAVDVVPAARTVLFRGVADVAGLRRLLEDLWAGLPDDRPGAADRGPAPVVEVPTRYDGPDLETVARRWDVSTQEVVRMHTSYELTVAFCGFAPGFAYCTGLPERLQVPRLDSPRSRVPAGSVGLAGPFTGVYPTASPGGWQLIGRTALTLWDDTREHPATLAPGTRVRFVAVTS